MVVGLVGDGKGGKMCLKFWKKKNNAGGKEGILQCPRCNVGMKKLKKGDVVIDHCRKCWGIWLDDKEIDKLVAFGEGKQNLKKK